MIGVFHHRVIDRFAGDLAELGRVRVKFSTVLAAFGHCCARVGGDSGAIARQLVKEGARAERENPPVPGVSARSQKLLGAGAVGLFHEPRDVKPGSADRRALLQIAEAGFGRGRFNPERHQPALPGQGGGGARGGLERCAIGNVVVAGADQHHGIGGQPQRRQGNRRSRIAR